MEQTENNSQLSDDKLVASYNAGDQEALNSLIHRYLNQIYIFAHRMTGSQEEAKDIAQETFVKVWRTIARYKMTGTFKAWIFAIARNTAIDKLRKKKSAVFSDFEDVNGKNTLTETLSDPETLPATLIEKAEKNGLLGKALLTLNPDDRAILSLHYSEDMTFEMIGKTLKKPLNTVKSRHRRALARLREYFEKYET